jgi:hypothetical protein
LFIWAQNVTGLMLMIKKYFSFCVLLSIMLLFGCSSSNIGRKKDLVSDKSKAQVSMPSPPVIIYKTKNDYNNKVPVILSDDKTRVVSFPDPVDLRINGEFVYPAKLNEGFLLDNRGINQHAAFLKFSYEEYCSMDNKPTAERLFGYLLDSNPFIEMYQCGNRGDYHDMISDINTLITTGKMKDCRNLLK